MDKKEKEYTSPGEFGAMVIGGWVDDLREKIVSLQAENRSLRAALRKYVWEGGGSVVIPEIWFQEGPVDVCRDPSVSGYILSIKDHPQTNGEKG